jgi:hypothetical protein
MNNDKWKCYFLGNTLQMTTDNSDKEARGFAWRVSRNWMPSSDLNIASRLQESRSAHAYGFHTITWWTSSRQASRRSRIEIACRDPVNRPRPTFASAREIVYTPRTRIRSQTMNFAFVTFELRERGEESARPSACSVVRDRKSSNNWKCLSASNRLSCTIFRAGRDTQKVENAEHYERHALTFSLYYFYFFVPSILTSLMGYRSKCCYTKDTSHRWGRDDPSQFVIFVSNVLRSSFCLGQ